MSKKKLENISLNWSGIFICLAILVVSGIIIFSPYVYSGAMKPAKAMYICEDHHGVYSIIKQNIKTGKEYNGGWDIEKQITLVQCKDGYVKDLEDMEVIYNLARSKQLMDGKVVDSNTLITTYEGLHKYIQYVEDRSIFGIVFIDITKIVKINEYERLDDAR